MSAEFIGTVNLREATKLTLLRVYTNADLCPHRTACRSDLWHRIDRLHVYASPLPELLKGYYTARRLTAYAATLGISTTALYKRVLKLTKKLEQENGLS